MIIIDAQVHVWPPDRPDRRLGDGVGDRKPYGYEQLIADMDRAGVDRAILVPPSFDADRNDYALEGARRYPDRFAVMGRIAVYKPESRTLLAGWKNQPGMLGIRIAFHQGRSKLWLEDGTADWLWDAAERYNVPIMAFAPDAVPKLGEVAERHPGLRLIVDHMGLSSALRGKSLEPAVADLLKLARFGNLAVKVSALPCYVDEPYPFPTLHPLIHRVVDAFGPQRSFWGTDLSHLTCPYKQCLTLFTEELKFLSASDKEWIMGRGIAEWINWPLSK